MKYLLTVELTREECLRSYLELTIPDRNDCAEIKRELAKLLGFECPNCGEPSGWVETGHLCTACQDSQHELLALSRAIERDREASTGENSPAEPLED